MLSAVDIDANEPIEPVDQTWACERLAERLRTQGRTHPVAAAVALSARGHAVATPAAFANHLGIDPTEWDQLEAGEIAFAALPDGLRQRATAVPLDLDALAVLAQRLGPRER
jgi:hypothetical protein